MASLQRNACFYWTCSLEHNENENYRRILMNIAVQKTYIEFEVN